MSHSTIFKIENPLNHFRALILKTAIFVSAVFLLAGCSSHSPGTSSDPHVLTSEVGPVTSAHACSSDTTATASYTWCIDQPENSTNTEEIVFLHGLGGSEQSWQLDLSALNTALKIKQGHAPTVISISFGQAWLLSDISRGGLPSMYQAFFSEALPAVEAHLPTHVSKRILLGLSMGGFNAIQVLARNANVFERVALVCPAISTLSPYASDADIQAFIASHQPYVKPENVYKAQGLAKVFFITPEEWSLHDPLVLTNKLSAASPPLYVASDDQDEYGFYDGGNQFQTQAKARGAEVTWVSIGGEGHCGQTPDSLLSLVNFLAP